jgi:hypothetical protein
MKSTVERDSLLTGLSTLPPDPVRSARTRQRCRTALQRRVRVADPVGDERGAGSGRRQPTGAELAFRKSLAGAVGILCVVYVAALIAITMSLQSTTP